MKTIHFLFPVLTASLGLATPLAAQQAQASDQRALGRVAFATSCAPAVQEDFDRAVAMLHSFWYMRSEEAFASVAREDPACVMAYWGIAMSRFHQLWEKPGPEDLRVGRTALERARAAGAASQRERTYIAALERFYDGTDVSHLDRMRAYESAMEELHDHFAEREAAIFYALALLGTAYSSPPDPSYARQKKAGAILQEILAAQPNHPGVAHYIIHSYDYPGLAQRALEAARRYATIAPDAPHALHMPSHIFTRLGLWQESIASNRAAAAAAHRDGWIGEEFHATDYLVYAYLQGAQDGEVDKLLASPGSREFQPGVPNYFAALYASAAMPARFAVERRRWHEAATLAVPEDVFQGGASCWAEATLYYARGLGAARTGDVAGADAALKQLTDCERVLRQADEQLWADQVEVQRRAVSAWSAAAEGREDEALGLMRSAADLEDGTDKHPVTPGAIVPARELLGEMLLEQGEPAEALREFERALAAAPNRFRSLYGAARAAEAADAGRAREHYSQLLELCRFADSEREELRQARAFLEAGEAR